MGKAKRVGSGRYLYKGYLIYNLGYFHTEHQVIWEAVNPETNCGDYHAYTLKDIKRQIDEENGESR